MIPDKIYLHEEDFSRIYTQPSSTIDDDVCYIRKDTLLEWLENKVSLSYGVATDALVEVIDKLNSL